MPALGSASTRRAHREGRSRGLISFLQLALAVLCHSGASHGLPFIPTFPGLYLTTGDEKPKAADNPSLWLYLVVAFSLVLLGGAFAGLTIALMGQDEMYLQVISTSGEGAEKKNAGKVLKLLQRGKHWVLVTLLVGNVITNETLPIVLDRSIGGGYAAAISSTVLVIVFGEIVPQSICVRFGLPIGAWCSPMVLLLMWIFAPITWPIAKLLDYLLGEEHGTTYKKAGLKTLVTLHQTVGTTPGERLNEDEVQIISGVLDLKAKPVGSIMTPMSDVFTLSADAVLDEDMIEVIMREGYSRIPIHEPTNKDDYVGMLLVKMLITYDPEDGKHVNEFALATLPETRPDTSCLDIINFFQQGKSHMVLVSASPGESFGALGVVTLEDVIEELIGEEIIDESDVFIDIHKAIRRGQPAPTHRHHLRVQKGEVVEDENSRALADEGDITTDGTDHTKVNGSNGLECVPGAKRASIASMDLPHSPRRMASLMRRASSIGSVGQAKSGPGTTHAPEMRQQLRRLGPSNVASHPTQTRISTVKVKPGVGTIPENAQVVRQIKDGRSQSQSEGQVIVSPLATGAQGGIGEGLVTPGLDARDGVQTVQAGYGTWDRNASPNTEGKSQPVEEHKQRTMGHEEVSTHQSGRMNDPAPSITIERSESHSTLGSLRSDGSDVPRRRQTARSGSINEQIIETGGRMKLVLEPSSSSEEERATSTAGKGGKARSKVRESSHTDRHRGQEAMTVGGGDGEGENEGASKAKKKRRHRTHRNKKKGGEGKGGGDENTPLLGPSRD